MKSFSQSSAMTQRMRLIPFTRTFPVKATLADGHRAIPGQEFRRSSGRLKWNVVPTPTWLSAQILPPCASTIHCEM